jgi:hypothetical protein
MAWTALGHADSTNSLFGQGVSLDLSENTLYENPEGSDSL